jgi:hypothetical protein
MKARRRACPAPTPQRPRLGRVALRWAVAAGLATSLASPASADVPSPDPEGCRLECKKEGTACACRNGNPGTCVVERKQRPGCPGGPPCDSETLWCAPTKPAPAAAPSSGSSPKRFGCSAGAGGAAGAPERSGALAACLALVAAAVLARRRRR